MKLFDKLVLATGFFLVATAVIVFIVSQCCACIQFMWEHSENPLVWVLLIPFVLLYWACWKRVVTDDKDMIETTISVERKKKKEEDI